MVRAVKPARGPSDAESEIEGRLAAEAKVLAAGGHAAAARERFEEIVARQQRRASRIAFYYLRDAADADEAVQDAFVKAFIRLDSFREGLPFQAWFTRILVNGCLDRLKARKRRDRWLFQGASAAPGAGDPLADRPSAAPSPEEALLARERRDRLARALERLPGRQRDVFVLSHYDGQSTRDVAAVVGLSESTVRVHLFRAVRSLRALLAEEGTAGTRSMQTETPR